MFNSWQDILNLNNTGLPPIVGGVPRSGSTYLYRNLAATMNPRKWELEEYFNPMYQFKYDSSLKVKIWVDWEKTAATKKIHPRKFFDRSLAEERYIKLTQCGVNNAFMKVFWNHLYGLHVANSSYHSELMKNYWWVHPIEQDWLNALLSFTYANHFNKWHYYGREPLIEQPFEAKNQTADYFLNIYRGLYQRREQHQYVVLYTSEFSHLNNISDRPPRRDVDKNNLYPTLITNYDSYVEHATKTMHKGVIEYSNGWYYLDSNNQLHIKEK